jgi:hypothetical protein
MWREGSCIRKLLNIQLKFKNVQRHNLKAAESSPLSLGGERGRGIEVL